MMRKWVAVVKRTIAPYAKSTRRTIHTCSVAKISLDREPRSIFVKSWPRVRMMAWVIKMVKKTTMRKRKRSERSLRLLDVVAETLSDRRLLVARKMKIKTKALTRMEQ